MRILIAVALAALTACGGGSQPSTSATPSPGPSHAVEDFMKAVADSNLIRMAELWGTKSGSAAETGKPASDDIRARKKSFPVVYAFDQLEGEALARLQRIYTSPPGDGDVPEVLALLEEAGSREAAMWHAEQWAQQAVETLRPLELDPERRADIEAIAAFLVHRRA